MALLVAFKTTRNEFRSFGIILPQTEDRAKCGWVWILNLDLALGIGVLNKLAAAGNAAKTRGSAISEGRSPRETRHREAK